MSRASRVTDVLMGQPTDPQDSPQQSCVEGVVHSIDATGMYYTIPSWDTTLLFGPSPYPPYQINGLGPQENDRCLVTVADTEQWVIGWWPHG